jgi:hypothetical protein
VIKTTDEQEARAEEIANDVHFYMGFTVGLPLTQEEIEEDLIRAELSKAVLNSLIIMSKKYPNLTLDYTFGHGIRHKIPIPLIED